MTRRWIGALVVAAAAVASCGHPTAAALADPDPLGVEVVAFVPDGWATGTVVAMADAPIVLGHFAGRYGKAERSAVAPPPDEPDRTYVAVAASTRCRLATGVEVRRVGDDLRVRFTGGTDLPECVRSYGPAAVVSVPTADVIGVRTVNGEAPVDPAGPGRLTSFVPLGTGPVAAAPIELGRTVPTGGPFDVPAVAAAVAAPVPAGSRAFAFVLTGCRETGAVLLVSREVIDAEPTGGNGAACSAPESYLATFVVPDDAVPPKASLGGS